MPIAEAAIGWSRIATSARPTRPRSRFQPITNITTVIASVNRYSHWSGLSFRPNGASGLTMTMPCTPPVQCSTYLFFSSCGIVTPSAKVASAR